MLCGLLVVHWPERKGLACDYRPYSIRAIGDHRLLAVARMPACHVIGLVSGSIHKLAERVL